MEIVSYGPDNIGLPPPAKLGPMSSDKPGEIERIQFVISNIRNPLRPGKLKGPVVGDSIKDIFGVHIYSIAVADNSQTIKLKYYNNRVNDPALNRTLQPWFSGTSNNQIEIVPNQIWSAAAEFADARSNVITDLVFTVKLYAGVPPGGLIRFKFPPHFTELFRVKSANIVTTNGVTEESWGELTVYATNDPNDQDFPGNLTAQRQWEGKECRESKSGCTIPPMSVIRVTFFEVKTPSTSVSGGLQVV